MLNLVLTILIPLSQRVYLELGIKHFSRGLANAGRWRLSRRIALWCDGRRVSLPEAAEGVIVLNINSHGGGTDLWGRSREMMGWDWIGLDWIGLDWMGIGLDGDWIRGD